MTTTVAALYVDAELATWGGVLEHPADSRLWRALSLPTPGGLPRVVFGRSMIALALDQLDFGHPCRKPTWILLAGVEPAGVPALATRATHRPRACIGGTKEYRQRHGLPVVSKVLARHTPPAFAAWLVSAARQASQASTAGPLATIADRGSLRSAV